MNARRWALRLAAMLLVGVAGFRAAPAGAQQPSVPLERFMLQVARLWASGDADALVSLAPADGRLVLDVGSQAGGVVQARHASATLRALFNERETLSVRPTRTTIASSRPAQGFGELAWVSRPRGMPAQRSATVYVGVVAEGEGWRIREIRVLR